MARVSYEGSSLFKAIKTHTFLARPVDKGESGITQIQPFPNAARYACLISTRTLEMKRRLCLVPFFDTIFLTV